MPLTRLGPPEIFNGENVSGVTGPYGVTVLPTLITLKFVHQKFKQKYEWMEHTSIYHHASLFCFFLHKFLFNLKLCMIVDAYMLYPFIFLNNFLCINLNVIKVGNS